MNLKLGAKLSSAVCDTEVMVLKSPKSEMDLCCGGVLMLEKNDEASSAEAVADFMTETLTGKRYVNEDESLELLCSKGGAGGLSLGETALAIKQPKALPSSD